MAKEKLTYWFLTSASVIGLTITAFQYAMENYFTEGKIVIDRLENSARVTGSAQDTGDLANLVKAGALCADAFEKRYEQSLVPSGKPKDRPFIQPNKYPLPSECITWPAPKERSATEIKASWIKSVDWNWWKNILLMLTSSSLGLVGILRFFKKNYEKHERKPTRSSAAIPYGGTYQPGYVSDPNRMKSSPSVTQWIRDWTGNNENKISVFLLNTMAPTRIVQPVITPDMSELRKNQAKVAAVLASDYDPDVKKRMTDELDTEYFEAHVKNY